MILIIRTSRAKVPNLHKITETYNLYPFYNPYIHFNGTPDVSFDFQGQGHVQQSQLGQHRGKAGKNQQT